MIIKGKAFTAFEFQTRHYTNKNGQPASFSFMSGTILTEDRCFIDCTISTDEPMTIKQDAPVSLKVQNLESVGDSGAMYKLRGKVA